MDISRYSAMIFDCDGVILDSNKVKSKAFAAALKGEDPKLIDEFVHYHQLNGGISRFVKFEYFFKIIKGQKKYQEDLSYTLNRYAKLVYKELLGCDEIKGIRGTLDQLRKFNIDCFVVSGGEQAEVRDVLKKRDFSHFFKRIYGSPITKKQHLATIKSTKSLYFGDARSDYEAADFFGMDFIYISGASEWVEGINFCQQNDIMIFKDFTEIKNLK
jgi:beta-phosphoglucomutase-like phosphatase (HAD superfamily)